MMNVRISLGTLADMQGCYCYSQPTDVQCETEKLNDLVKVPELVNGKVRAKIQIS